MSNTRFSTTLITGLIVFASLIGGCVSTSSSGITYYLLKSIAGDVVSNKSIVIGVGPVEVPAYLDRPHLMTRSGKSALQADKQHRWAAPIETLVTDALKNNLSLRLPAADVSSYPWDAQRRVERQFIITINEFIASSDSVELTGRWRLFNRSGKRLQADAFSYRIATQDNGHDATVNAMAEAIAALSDNLAHAVR